MYLRFAGRFGVGVKKELVGGIERYFGFVVDGFLGGVDTDGVGLCVVVGLCRLLGGVKRGVSIVRVGIGINDRLAREGPAWKCDDCDGFACDCPACDRPAGNCPSCVCPAFDVFQSSARGEGVFAISGMRLVYVKATRKEYQLPNNITKILNQHIQIPKGIPPTHSQ